MRSYFTSDARLSATVGFWLTLLLAWVFAAFPARTWATGIPSPSNPAIAYMLDISRDKVPTMASLYRIADVLADLGYNQFQLYMEHTFAYSGHEQAWRDSSPMTAFEIRALDWYCARKGIVLVPCQNSFGHLEKWFRRPKYRPLAEVPYGGVRRKTGLVRTPRALCATSADSLRFLDSLYGELFPNFDAAIVNIGCDEVWDLESGGKGRSWAAVTNRGSARVWLDYVTRVCRLAKKHGKTAMVFDDMITRKHPELVSALPPDVIALDWGYEIGCNFSFDKNCGLLAQAGRPFYVCPGTSGWNSMSGRHANMKANVREAVTAGLKHGACGFMLMDWGNGGACQPWITALPALIYMSNAVRGRWLDDRQIAGEVNRIAGVNCGDALLRYQNLYLLDGNPAAHYKTELYRMLAEAAKWKRPAKGMSAGDLLAVFCEWRSAKASLDLRKAPDWVRDGFRTMDVLYSALELRSKGEHDRVQRELAPEFSGLWLRHNRPGGLRDSLKQNFKGSRTRVVVLAFDARDCVTSQDADNVLGLARILEEEGATGHFILTSDIVRRLQACGRDDVIRVLGNHVICSDEGLDASSRVALGIRRVWRLDTGSGVEILHFKAVATEQVRRAIRECMDDPSTTVSDIPFLLAGKDFYGKER